MIMKLRYYTTGYWRINNEGSKYKGDLYLNKKYGGIVIYIRIPNDGPIMSMLELPLQITFLSGSTIDGYDITLVNCERIITKSIVRTEEIFGYQAQFLFNGIKFTNEEDIRFSKMKISIPGIIKWGNISNYVKPNIDKNKDSLIELKIMEPIDIYSNENYTISYDVSFSDPFDLMKEEITLKQTPYLIIKSNKLQTLEWFLKIANDMKRLIEISIGLPLSFDQMVVESPKIYYEFEKGDKVSRPLDVIHSFINDTNVDDNNRKLSKHEYLFHLNELREANFSNWQEISTIMEPIIELYIDTIYNENLSMNRHFLHMVQALETYHSRRIANSLPEYKKRIEELLDMRPSSFRNDDRKFLLDGCTEHVTLRSRLADLILAEFKYFFYTGDFKRTDFPKIVAQTRNYYTHYNQRLKKKALTGENLRIAIDILRNILEFYILKELGFRDDFIHERIRERIKPVKTSIEVRRADQEKHGY